MEADVQGWDALYAAGQDANEEPWSNVVSFVNRWVRPLGGAPAALLELGCGTGPNLRFAARLGFACSGIDASSVAVAQCRQRLAREGLSVDVRHSALGALPFADDSFDCVVDRASLMFADAATLTETVAEVHRVLKPGGLFFHNTICDMVVAGLLASPDGDGRAGTRALAAYTKYPDFRPTSASDLRQRFGPAWRVRALRRIERTSYVPVLDITAEWELVAQKI